jgi:CHAT domain-containing protein
LQQEANDLEKELVRRSAGFAEQRKLARPSWQQVRAALKQGEAAVELVRFRFDDGKKWTDKNHYAALVVTPQTTAPKFVLLGEASKLEGDPLAAYQQHVGLASAAARAARGSRPVVTEKPAAAVLPVGNFYQAFWKPLEAALGGAKRVYLSPDGVLNQVSLGVVPAADGRLLLENYDLRIVSSTKDLLRQPGKPSGNTAVLVGNPDFSLDETRYRATLKSVQRTEVAALRARPGAAVERSAELRGGSLNPLPGTQVEVEAVSSVLTKQRWNVEVFTQQNALEETVKRVRNPRVLHVATHGFFEADQERKQRELGDNRPSGLEDPMLRSGLYFAGADRARAGKTGADDLDDGVLTAYEATQLNLQGTELVVLSACETGLGETSASEGVFGLRRALQVAGAEAVLMSMWAVPDKETQELMTLFYQKWLGGEDKHQALRESQLEMRERVKKRYGEDRPRLWGAFVLVGR